MTPASTRSLGLICLLTGCFGEPFTTMDAADSTDATPEDTDTGQVGTGADTQVDPSAMSMSASSIGTGSADGSTDDSTADSGTAAPPDCGELAEPCCADQVCGEGACLLGTCVAFAGGFLDGELCPECPSVLAALECGCPPGFETSPALELLSSGCIKDDKVLPWVDEVVQFCEASAYVPGRSDWGGAYMRADVPTGGCEGAPDCAVGNPYADDVCECPPQSTAVEVLVYGHCGGDIPDPPPAYRLGFCVGDDVDPITFGGIVYAEGPTCLAPHPETGSCECPAPLSRTNVRVISQATPNVAGDLGFCVQNPG